MHNDLAKKVWFDPWKYWAATANMSAEDADSLMNEVLHHAEAGDVEALGRYAFLTFEDPVRAWRLRRESQRLLGETNHSDRLIT